MTINDAINRLDTVLPNTYSRSEKVKWLSTLDGTIFNDILSHYKGYDAFVPYTDETDPDTELLVGEPYDSVYEHYLCAQVNYANRELASYNNAMAMYNAVLSDYRNDYNRKHTHITAKIRTI